MLERILEPEIMDSLEDAAEYEAIDNAKVNAEFVRFFTAEVGFNGGRVLDLGTGPADIAIAIAEASSEAQVTGLDLGSFMMKAARRRVAASPARDRITLVEADAKATGFASESFDFIICNSLVHHIPDPRQLFAEVVRLLAPGGGLFLKDLRRPASLAELRALVATYAANDTPYQRELFHNSLHAALLPEEVAEVARSAGLLDAVLTTPSDRHWQLVRPAQRKKVRK